MAPRALAKVIYRTLAFWPYYTCLGFLLYFYFLLISLSSKAYTFSYFCLLNMNYFNLAASSANLFISFYDNIKKNYKSFPNLILYAYHDWAINPDMTKPKIEHIITRTCIDSLKPSLTFINFAFI